MVIGDYDVDGATSCALVHSALRTMGGENIAFIAPNRFQFGYGMSPEIVEYSQQYKPDILITVDNGISSISGVAAAKNAGVRVLITDHHLPGSELPDADVIVNPNQPGDQFASKNLAGVGVAFYVMMALRRELRRRNWFSEMDITEPNMARFLDLVALGTVADVVSLDHNNRVLVSQGLGRINAGLGRPGINALLKISKRTTGEISTTDLGFAVAPRLNAAGRLEDMSIGIACLLAENDEQAMDLAYQLDTINSERRLIEREMQQEAFRFVQSVAREPEKNLPAGLCFFEPHWHQGLTGLVASRIKDRFNRPVIAFADAGDGILKGSGRSIAALHLKDALDAIALQAPKLVENFGGHAMAAGLTIRRKYYSRFEVAFQQEVNRRLGTGGLSAEIESDGILPHREMNVSFAQTLRKAGPWGKDFPEPVFDGEFNVFEQRIVGEQHLKLQLKGDDGENVVDAIYFRYLQGEEVATRFQRVRIVYRLAVNDYMGRRRPQLIVDYLEPVS